MKIEMQFDKFMKLLPKIFNLVERIANESCCLCRDKCLTCDANDLIKELTEK